MTMHPVFKIADFHVIFHPLFIVQNMSHWVLQIQTNSLSKPLLSVSMVISTVVHKKFKFSLQIE